VPLDIDEAVRTHYGRIHRAALVLTGNPWDADDLAQETFVEALRSAHRFAGTARAYTWLYAILLRCARQRRRGHRRWLRRMQELWQRLLREATTDAPADGSLEVRQWRESLWAEVARLPTAQRDVLVLRYSEGLTYEEIAEVLGCPPGTAKSRVHHGLKKLRARLGSEDRRTLHLEVPPAVCKKPPPGESCYGC
jgi:RNA polymerase sigma-70 factor (ECF subfamily)